MLKPVDNITHSLIGGVAAELALGRVSEEHRARLRPAFWTVSLLANNFPDLDIVIPMILGQGRIDYLLHHRGHTHTWLLAIPQALLCWALVLMLMRKRDWEPRERWWLLGVAVLGGFLHIFADSWNIYGIHPLWPLHNGWYFGDAVFIIEPLLWLTLSPALAFTFAGRARWILLMPQGVLLFLAWTNPILTPPLKVLVTIGVAATPLWKKAQNRVATAVTCASLVVMLFHGLSWEVRHEFRSATKDTEWKEIGLAPFPSNPLCWSVFSTRIVSGEYRATVGTFRILSAASCPPLRHVSPTALLTQPNDLAQTEKLEWFGEFRAPVAELKSILRESCAARAAMRFYRIPVWTISGRTVVLGDLRFDHEPGLGFSEIVVNRDETACPVGVPPWTPPTEESGMF